MRGLSIRSGSPEILRVGPTLMALKPVWAGAAWTAGRPWSPNEVLGLAWARLPSTARAPISGSQWLTQWCKNLYRATHAHRQNRSAALRTAAAHALCGGCGRLQRGLPAAADPCAPRLEPRGRPVHAAARVAVVDPGVLQAAVRLITWTWPESRWSIDDAVSRSEHGSGQRRHRPNVRLVEAGGCPGPPTGQQVDHRR